MHLRPPKGALQDPFANRPVVRRRARWVDLPAFVVLVPDWHCQAEGLPGCTAGCTVVEGRGLVGLGRVPYWSQLGLAFQTVEERLAQAAAEAFPSVRKP
jgi:hypothetical protein